MAASPAWSRSAASSLRRDCGAPRMAGPSHGARCGAFAIRVVALVLALGFLRASAAHAHKVKVFATAEEDTISGYVYFSGGNRPRSAVIRIAGPGGAALGEAKTNENGEFSFKAKYSCDHILTMDLEDGHAARFTIKSEELPAGLPPLPRAPEKTLGEAGTPPKEPVAEESESVMAPGASEVSGSPSRPGMETAVAEAVVAEAVSRQIRPLREQLDRLEAKIRLSDVVGGIGCLFGVTGIAFYFLGVRKRERDAPRRGS